MATLSPGRPITTADLSVLPDQIIKNVPVDGAAVNRSASAFNLQNAMEWPTRVVLRFKIYYIFFIKQPALARTIEIYF